MFDEQDAREQLPKAVAAQHRVRRINSDIDIEAIVADVNHTNIEALIADADLVLDGTDNFETRFLINDACVKHRKPWIYGAAVGSYGLTMVVIPHRTPCLRCVFESAPPPGTSPTCDTAGVILPVVSIVAALQAAEALKILTGNLERLHGGLVQIDVWQGTHTKLNLAGLREGAECRCCAQGLFDYLEADTRQLTTTMCGRNSVQIVPGNGSKIDLAALAERLRPSGEVSLNRFLLRFKAAGFELTVFPDARSIIHGTKDESVARSLYAKYIGV
jgi:adenylyltransferase/sulfurtransferase